MVKVKLNSKLAKGAGGVLLVGLGLGGYVWHGLPDQEYRVRLDDGRTAVVSRYDRQNTTSVSTERDHWIIDRDNDFYPDCNQTRHWGFENKTFDDTYTQVDAKDVETFKEAIDKSGMRTE